MSRECVQTYLITEFLSNIAQEEAPILEDDRDVRESISL